MPRIKPPILFIHGFRGSPVGNLEAVAILRKDFEVHNPKIPPTGKNNLLPEYTSDSYADFIAQYIKQHKLKKPVLVGHSMGSIIAAATIEKYPDLVNNKAVLVSPISHKVNRLFRSLQTLVFFLPADLISYITTRFLFVPYDKALFRKALLLTKQSASLITNKRALFKSASFSASYAVTDYNPRDKEIMMIAGAKDRLMPIKFTKDFAQKNHTQLKIVQNAGHLINYENPAAIAEYIKDFIG
jgi:pimeloyl-ACP methyl ester carboxylesterase